MEQEILEQNEQIQDNEIQENENAEVENNEDEIENKKTTEEIIDKTPETYDFQNIELPEGIIFDDKLAQKFTPVAKELNLSQEDASKLVNMLVEHQKEQLGNQKEIIAEFKRQELEATKIEYQKLLNSDNEISGKGEEHYNAYLNVADKGYRAFASESLMNVIEQYGLEYHPDVIKHFYRLGKLCGQDNIQISKNPVGEKESAAEILYGER